MISCATLAADGMVVHTQSEKVKQAQASVMEFLLINHPLDCSICDQAGECRLQEYAVEYGTGKSRYEDEKALFGKAVERSQSTRGLCLSVLHPGLIAVVEFLNVPHFAVFRRVHFKVLEVRASGSEL